MSKNSDVECTAAGWWHRTHKHIWWAVCWWKL